MQNSTGGGRGARLLFCCHAYKTCTGSFSCILWYQEKLPVAGSGGNYFINLVRLWLTRLQPNKN